MPQVNYPCAVAIDWLECFCESRRPFLQEPPVTRFSWEQKPFGSKMWEHIFEVFYSDDGSQFEPFAVVCSCLHGKAQQPRACSVKIANEQLYKPTLWARFFQFVQEYEIQIVNLSRIDLAADFIYLYGRVSGRQLVNNIKSCRWWKCGTAKVSEHYFMPYSVRWDFDPDDMDVDMFAQNGKIELKTESMTFGTKASFAQVCLYDKTCEIERHSVDGVCAKEYIRDTWKQAGVYDEKRHTWRIEIRLNSKALTIRDYTRSEGLRPVNITDIMPDRLVSTFLAAADVWFRLVDVTRGDPNFTITSDFIETNRRKKNRFPKVTLWKRSDFRTEFCSRPHQETASRFVKSMINRLERTARDFDTNKIPRARTEDPHVLREAAHVLRGIFVSEVLKERKEAETDYFCKLYIQLSRDLAARRKECGRNMELSREELSLLAFLTSDTGPISAQKRREIDQSETIPFYQSISREDLETIEQINAPTQPARLLEIWDPYQLEDTDDNDFMRWRLEVESLTL